MLLSLLHTGITPYGGQDRTAQHALRPPPGCSSYPSCSPHSTREHSRSAELAHAQSPQQLHAYRRRVSPANPYRWPRSILRQRRARGKGRMAPASSTRLPARFSGRCRVTAGRATRHRDGQPRTLPAPRGRPAGLLLPPRPGPALTQTNEEHRLHFPRRHLRSGTTARRGPGAQPRRPALRL